MVEVLIHGGSTPGLASGLIIHQREFNSSRPCYPSHPHGKDFWFLSDSLHDMIACPYTIRYYAPHWIIDIRDVNQALLFKLAWGQS